MDDVSPCMKRRTADCLSVDPASVGVIIISGPGVVVVGDLTAGGSRRMHVQLVLPVRRRRRRRGRRGSLARVVLVVAVILAVVPAAAAAVLHLPHVHVLHGAGAVVGAPLGSLAAAGLAAIPGERRGRGRRGSLARVVLVVAV